MKCSESKPTLRDVTELAGCSLAAASTILNGRNNNNVRYSEELADRVRESARKLGYRTRRRVQQLEPRRGVGNLPTHLPVGLIIHPYRNGFDSMESIFVEQLSRQLERFDMTQQMIYANDQFHVSRLRERMRRHGLAAAVTFAMGPEDDSLVSIQEAGLPVVIFNPYQVPRHNGVLPDDANGVKQACKLLSLIGAKRVLYVTAKTDHYSGQLRRDVLLEQLHEMNIALAGEFDHTNFSKQPLARLLKRSNVDTIICYNNSMALKAIACLSDMGIAVPDEINILSLAGLPAQADHGHITQMILPFDQMGRVAADLCIDMIKHQQANFENVLVPEYLHLGATCKRV
ncbi:MAG: LacI family DNA-binding transcriptional regulator [Phycisphaeraceae bacterium JB051]